MQRITNMIPAGSGGLFGMITATGIIQCIVYAAIGAIIGWGIKKLLDYIFKKYKNKKKEKYNKRNNW